MFESYNNGGLGSVQSGASIESPRCLCNLRAISTSAYTDENFGKRFWGCVKYKISCRSPYYLKCMLDVGFVEELDIVNFLWMGSVFSSETWLAIQVIFVQ